MRVITVVVVVVVGGGGVGVVVVVVVVAAAALVAGVLEVTVGVEYSLFARDGKSTYDVIVNPKRVSEGQKEVPVDKFMVASCRTMVGIVRKLERTFHEFCCHHGSSYS